MHDPDHKHPFHAGVAVALKSNPGVAMTVACVWRNETTDEIRISCVYLDENKKPRNVMVSPLMLKLY